MTKEPNIQIPEAENNRSQTSTLYDDVRKIIEAARSKAVRSVDFCRVQMYWHLGKVYSRKNNREKNVQTMAPIS